MTVARRMLFVAAILSLSAVVAASESHEASSKEAAGGFTLEQVLSAPFPTDLVAAPAQGKFAWVASMRGQRNIWIAEPAEDGKTYSTRSLTRYSADDGQDIGELAWTPDASAIAYTRGGDLEFSDKPAPNPAKAVEGVEQAVWVVALNGTGPRKVGEGHLLAISPQGGSLAYVLKDQIWLGKLADSDKPVQLLHTRGSIHSLRWSPDGSFLAFVSDRGDHSFIGLYKLASKTLEYLDPGSDHDCEPVWSPDSSQLAFLRLPSTPEEVRFQPQRAGIPWSIRLHSVMSGKNAEVWKAAEGPGSVFREVAADSQLLWGADDRIVFAWEQDGWTHLYAVAIGGGKAQGLTPGAFEVEYVSLSPDRTTVFYSSNQNDIDRRHIWKVAVAGGSPVAVTQGAGIETAPVVSSDSHTLALLSSDARLPLRPAIVSGSSPPRDLRAGDAPADFPFSQLITPQAVVLQSADGMAIHAQLFLPRASNSSERHPAVIFFHGGSRRQMLLGWHYMLYYSHAYALNQYLASRGYVVLSVNYRSGIGYGMEFREALNYGAAGASEFNDVEGAGVYLRSRPDVDPKRIALWGGSYGGYLTALGLARASDLFAAGVDFHGVHDWNRELRNWSPSYDPATQPDVARVAWEASPLASVNTWRSPVLLIHGDDDRNVPFSQTVALTYALRKQHVEFEQLIFPDEIHDFLLFRTWVAGYSAAADFLDRHLGNKPPSKAAP